jgi:LPXTG-motif cell wall-anchored protein
MPLNAQTATPQLSIIDQLKAKLNELKDRIKGGNLAIDVYTEVASSAKLLQDKLNELLAKKGLLTQSDVNDAYSVIQDVKRSELESQSKKSSTKLLIYVGAAILIIGGVLLYKKRK